MSCEKYSNTIFHLRYDMLSCAELQSAKLGPDQKCKDFMTRNMTNYHSAYRKKDYPIHDRKQNQARMRGLKRKAENQMTESDSSKNVCLLDVDSL